MAENGKAKYYALMEEMKTDILSGKRNLLCGCAPSDSRDRKHRSGDYIYLGLYFSKADPGD